MGPRVKKVLVRTLFFSLLLYVLVGIILYFFQDKILFHPVALDRNHHFIFQQHFEELNIPLADGNLSMLKFDTRGQKKGIVLFFHGNRQNVEHYAGYPLLFTKNGYEVWMIDYPGFGKTTGSRTEERMYDDAERMYERAIENTDRGKVIIYGKSLGTGVASYLAAKKEHRNLILETPYYSIESLASHYAPIYPVSLLANYSFPVFLYLKNSKRPITIFHGTDDDIIPYQQSVRLMKECRNVELVTIEAGKHNNLAGFDIFQKKLDSLLAN